jgi:hypothetical protein
VATTAGLVVTKLQIGAGVGSDHLPILCDVKWPTEQGYDVEWNDGITWGELQGADAANQGESETGDANAEKRTRSQVKGGGTSSEEQPRLRHKKGNKQELTTNWRKANIELFAVNLGKFFTSADVQARILLASNEKLGAELAERLKLETPIPDLPSWIEFDRGKSPVELGRARSPLGQRSGQGGVGKKPKQKNGKQSLSHAEYAKLCEERWKELMPEPIAFATRTATCAEPEEESAPSESADGAAPQTTAPAEPDAEPPPDISDDLAEIVVSGIRWAERHKGAVPRGRPKPRKNRVFTLGKNANFQQLCALASTMERLSRHARSKEESKRLKERAKEARRCAENVANAARSEELAIRLQEHVDGGDLAPLGGLSKITRTARACEEGREPGGLIREQENHVLLHEKTLLTSPQQQAEHFCKYYATEHLDGLSDGAFGNPRRFCDEILQRARGKVKLTHQELVFAVRRLKTSAAPGPDQLRVKAMKVMITVPVAQDALRRIIESIVNTGRCPRSWKRARVLPLLKPNKPRHLIPSWRPVALTSVLAKITEGILTRRLLLFIPVNKESTGYAAKHSSDDNVAVLVAKVEEARKKGRGVLAAFLDLRAAFDRLCTDDCVELMLRTWVKGGGLARLESGTQDGLKHTGAMTQEAQKLRSDDGEFLVIMRFFRSFLRGRKGQVCFAGGKSKPWHFKIGVPQGTLAGPQCFKFLFSDLLDLLAKDPSVTVLCYADDLALLVEYKERSVGVVKLQNVVDLVVGWTKQHNMQLSASKSVTCDFSPKSTAKGASTNAPCIKVDGKYLPADSTPRFLGVTFDRPLQFKAHFDSTLVKSKRRLGAIQKITNSSLEIKTRHVRALWCGLCASVGLFAVPIWGTQRNQTERAMLDAHKAAGAKTILGLPKSASGLAARSEAGLMDFEDELGMESAVLVSRAETRVARDEFSRSVETSAAWVEEGKCFAAEAGLCPGNIEKDFVPAEFIQDAAADIHRYIAESNLWLNTCDPGDEEDAPGEDRCAGQVRFRSERAPTSPSSTENTNGSEDGNMELIANEDGVEVFFAKVRGARAKGGEHRAGEDAMEASAGDGLDQRRTKSEGGAPKPRTGQQKHKVDDEKAEAEAEADVRIKIHSDGSAKWRRGGFAICTSVEAGGLKKSRKRRLKARGWKIKGLHVDAFVAEQLGVKKALAKARGISAPYLKKGKKVWFKIVTDSLSVIQSVGSAGPRDCRERQITRLVGDLIGAGAKGELAWERGHCGRAENELCDKKAKEACSKMGGDYASSRKWPWHVARAALKARTKQRQVARLEQAASSTAQFLSMVTQAKFQPSPTIRSLRKTKGGRRDEGAADVSRVTEITLNQMRANCFTGTREWAHRIGRATDPTCPECGAKKQDTAHVLLDCPAHAEERLRLRARIKEAEACENERRHRQRKRQRGLGLHSLQEHPLQVARFIEETGLVPHSWSVGHHESPLPATTDFPDPNGRHDWKISLNGCHIVLDGVAAPVSWETGDDDELHVLCSGKRFKISPENVLTETEAAPAPDISDDGRPVRRTTQSEKHAKLIRDARRALGNILELYLPGAEGLVSP